MEVREPVVVYGKKNLTVAEYLEFEKTSVEKHEYYRGELFAMAGAKVAHNRIVVRLTGLLSQQLRGKSCEPFNSDQRIHVPENTLFTYPDISIVCGSAVKTLDNDDYNILNPSIIIEVLSPASLKCCHPALKIMIAAKSSSYTGIFQRSKNTFS
jgi:Uma2 family endonuclease